MKRETSAQYAWRKKMGKRMGAVRADNSRYYSPEKAEKIARLSANLHSPRCMAVTEERLAAMLIVRQRRRQLEQV